MHSSKSETIKKIFFSFYLISYSVILSFSLAAFNFFKPITFIDNDHTYILCQQSQIRYETSPNFIFALDINLDPFNDKKARKLCGHSVIKDYKNVYQTPKEKNYKFLPAIRQDSSWFTALFVSFLTFAIGTFVLEFVARLFLKSTFLLDKRLGNFIHYLFE